jgi:predicted transcriptional regulator
MPIDIETFTEASTDELSQRTNAEMVIQFLYQNRDMAFTPAEIVEETDVKQSSIGTVLRRLEEKNLVRHKGDYWAIGDEERVRDAYRLHQTMEHIDDQYGAEDVEEWRQHAVEEPDE